MNLIHGSIYFLELPSRNFSKQVILVQISSNCAVKDFNITMLNETWGLVDVALGRVARLDLGLNVNNRSHWRMLNSKLFGNGSITLSGLMCSKSCFCKILVNVFKSWWCVNRLCQNICFYNVYTPCWWSAVIFCTVFEGCADLSSTPPWQLVVFMHFPNLLI